MRFVCFVLMTQMVPLVDIPSIISYCDRRVLLSIFTFFYYSLYNIVSFCDDIILMEQLTIIIIGSFILHDFDFHFHKLYMLL